MNLVFKPQSIIMLVGPSNSGKSYFSTNVLIPQLKMIQSNFNIQYLSSDNIRKELLGNDTLHKYDPSMMNVSDQAFNLLFTKMKNVTQFPVLADFVIVDTTGLDEIFRKKVKSVAMESNYSFHTIVFDFKNRDDFYTGVEDFNGKSIISKHIRRMKTDMKLLTPKNLINVQTIKSRDFSKLNIQVDQMYLSRLNRSKLENKETVIIGDVHGCYDELKELIVENQFEIDSDDNISNPFDKILVLVGDLIDKSEGEDIIKTVNFVYKNIDKPFVKVVLGNHENYVYKSLTGQLKDVDKNTSVDLTVFFNSVGVYEKASEQDRNNFFYVVEHSFEFFKNDLTIVTHAPCFNSHLGRLNDSSLKAMRNFRYPKTEHDLSIEDYSNLVETSLSFVEKDSMFNHPYHVFGHIAVDKVTKVKNKIFIDTGCVYGGTLSSVSITPFKKLFFKSVPSKRERIQSEFVSIFKDEKVSLDKFDPAIVRRARAVLNKKVNFLSGTMSPVNKSFERNELESLQEGILYYSNREVNELIIQPKFMGSRFTVYCNADSTKSFGVTRNGYVLGEELNSKLFGEYERLYNLFKSLDPIWQNLEWVIFDAELMPWSALGHGLIEDSFKSYSVGVRSELEILKSSGFVNALEKIKSELDKTNFSKDRSAMKKNELSKLYGESIRRTYTTFLDFQNCLKIDDQSMNDQFNHINSFNKQIDLYGQSGELKIEPFNVLKVILNDGSEIVNQNNTIFEQINSNAHHSMRIEFRPEKSVYSINDLQFKDQESFFIELNKQYNELTKTVGMEGVVIKPVTIDISGKTKVAPYLKCRNPEYLRIVYGHDYTNPVKYEKLINRKRIDHKVKMSINEFNLGYQLLNIPFKDLNGSNDEQVKIVCQLMSEMENEKMLDPRL